MYRSPDPGDHVDDARLQWTPVTVNIYGQATTVVRQEIYAGSTPNFKTDAAHRLATINDGVTGTWIHENGFGDAANHYYLVVSVDAAGNASGSSNDLPKGIDALTVKRIGGSLQFSWPAVSADVDGRRTVVASYTLYGRSSPFRRSDLAVGGSRGDGDHLAVALAPDPGRNPLLLFRDHRGQQGSPEPLVAVPNRSLERGPRRSPTGNLLRGGAVSSVREDAPCPPPGEEVLSLSSGPAAGTAFPARPARPRAARPPRGGPPRAPGSSRARA